MVRVLERIKDQRARRPLPGHLVSVSMLVKHNMINHTATRDGA